MQTTMERFSAKYIPDPVSGCWIWTAALRHGYGAIKANRKPAQAHRVAYELYVGPIPEGMCCLHRCDVPACVRPDHLWLGTQAENLADRDAKGRAAKGKQNGNGKKTPLQAWAFV